MILPYDSLSRRGQVGRLRVLARTALVEYGIEPAALVKLRHQHNTTFRVDAAGGPFVLRINRPGVHSAATIESEAAWLAALRRDTDVSVPSPVRTRDGRLVVEASAPGVPESRICVLFRWLDGRFIDRRLTPAHLREVGSATAALQLHADGWTPPAGFVRPRADTMTTRAKLDSTAPSGVAALAGDHPSATDARAMVELISELVSGRDGDLVEAAIDAIWATTRDLAAQSGSFGLIHGDLHHQNYFFEHGRFRAIDFDDCGWGFHLYDQMVTTSELEGHARYPELRDAVLEAYSARHPLPPRHEHHLEMLTALRRLQVVAWILESREHPAFRDFWQEWAREELDGLATQLDGA